MRIISSSTSAGLRITTWNMRRGLRTRLVQSVNNPPIKSHFGLKSLPKPSIQGDWGINSQFIPSYILAASFPNCRKSSTTSRHHFNLGGNRSLFWRMTSPMDEIILHFGKWLRPWTKTFSILENDFAHGQKRFPFWKMTSPMDENIFHFGGWFRP